MQEETIQAAVDAATLEEVVDGLSAGFHIPRMIVVIAAAIVLLIAAKVLSCIIRKALKGLAERSHKFTPMMAGLSSKIVSAVIWLVAAVAALGLFGIDLTPVLAGLGITGVVLGFALQESISSLFSGVMIAINNPFRVGDWVDIGSVSGTVESMDMMCVTLSSGDNKKITMNNKTVWSSTIVNYSYIDKRRLDMTVSIRYEDDAEKAKAVIRDLIGSYPEVLKMPGPVIEVGEYGASSVVIYVRPWVHPDVYWDVYWRFNSDILSKLRENGLDMPFDQLTVHIEK